MRSFIKSFSLTAALALASVSAFAVPTLVISDGINTPLAFTDGGLGDLSANGDGEIQIFNQTIGNWTVSLSGAITNQFPSTATEPFLTLNSTVKLDSPANTGSLTILFYEQGFMADPFQGLLTGGVSSSSLAGTGEISAEVNNATYAGGSALPFGADSLNILGPGQTPLSNYTLGLRTVVNVTGVTNSARLLTISANLAAVPEPGFYGALAVGLSGLFAMAARRRRAAEKE